MRPLAQLTALAASAVVVACSSASGPALVVADGWMREPVPGATATAAYFVLENRGDLPVIIDGVSSPQFARVGFHTTRVVDGSMQMRPIERLVVPASGRIALEPGGDHVMLGAPRLPIESIRTLELTLSSGGAPVMTLSLAVSRTAPGSDPT